MSKISTILEGRLSSPPNMLDALQKVQNALGYVPPESVPEIATLLGVSPSDVAGVLSFYHDLRTHPPGRHTIRYCMGESCLAMRAKDSLKVLEKSVGCALGETSKDGRFSMEKVYCLGNCALSPSMSIDETVYGRLTPENVSKKLEAHL